MCKKLMIEDSRPIKSVWLSNGQVDHKIGVGGITAIIPYGEYGNGGFLTWLAVYRSEEIVRRINTLHVEEIAYE